MRLSCTTVMQQVLRFCPYQLQQVIAGTETSAYNLKKRFQDLPARCDEGYGC